MSLSTTTIFSHLRSTMVCCLCLGKYNVVVAGYTVTDKLQLVFVTPIQLITLFKNQDVILQLHSQQYLQIGQVQCVGTPTCSCINNMHAVVSFKMHASCMKSDKSFTSIKNHGLYSVWSPSFHQMCIHQFNYWIYNDD